MKLKEKRLSKTNMKYKKDSMVLYKKIEENNIKNESAIVKHTNEFITKLDHVSQYRNQDLETDFNLTGRSSTRMKKYQM